MKRNLFGVSGTLVAALLMAGCVEDPTTGLIGTAASVSTSLSYVEIEVGDSVVAAFAQTKDQQGNALAILPEVVSNGTNIATVDVDEAQTGNPQPRTIFSIIAVGFGQTTLTASSEGFTADVTVQTWPAQVEILNFTPGEQVLSGTTRQLGVEAQTTTGAALPGPDVATFVWASANDTIAEVDQTGLVAFKRPGLAVITATTDGGAVGQASLEVVPAPFDGGITANADFADIVTITPGALAWDGGETFLVNGDLAPTWIEQDDNTGFAFRVDALPAGANFVIIGNVGDDQLSYRADFTVGTAWTPVGDPADGADLTAGPFPMEFYVSLSGSDPNYFTYFEPGADLDLTVTIEWNNDADMDILWCNAACSAFVGNFSGATTANPQVSSVTVPAGTRWNLWLNAYDMHDNPPTIVKVTVESP